MSTMNQYWKVTIRMTIEGHEEQEEYNRVADPLGFIKNWTSSGASDDIQFRVEKLSDKEFKETGGDE